MDMTELRKKQFVEVFNRHGAEVDWKLLSDNFTETPEYEWKGLLHSIEVILRMKMRKTN